MSTHIPVFIPSPDAGLARIGAQLLLTRLQPNTTFALRNQPGANAPEG
ncbi:hypothetical protein [Myxococcus sp. NMCA1]|nr:hypothetical protein [Myxococcus sp. NMCA1]WAM30068.1 hypothetical protein OZ403_18825 [Myxococcus sp. NMCA1]